MAKNEIYKKLIHSNRWVQLRHKVISSHPLCVMCERNDILTCATEVHHITPVETALTQAEMSKLMFDECNLMPLCHACHTSIHVQEKKGTKTERRRRNKRHLNEIIKRFYE